MAQRVKEYAFGIIEASEEIEGFKFSPDNVKSTNDDLLKNISKEVIMEFLEMEETKVWAVKNKLGDYDIVAHNTVSDEMVQISGLGNHFMALVKIVKQAQKYANNPDAPLMTHRFIKDINLQILLNRDGEVGIGEYRYLNFLGLPYEVNLGEVIVNGRRVPYRPYIQLETSERKNVYKKMDELVDWVNNEAFKNPDNFMRDIAKFHADFIRIHPFGDGNGRTARLLTNYLLLVNDKNMINIPAEKRENYARALNFANAKFLNGYTHKCGIFLQGFLDESEENREFYEKFVAKYGERTDDNKYLPLAHLLEKFSITHCNNLINEILGYKKTRLPNFVASQIK